MVKVWLSLKPQARGAFEVALWYSYQPSLYYIVSPTFMSGSEAKGLEIEITMLSQVELVAGVKELLMESEFF
jgi:hypothetical protein